MPYTTGYLAPAMSDDDKTKAEVPASFSSSQPPLFFWKPSQEHGYLSQWYMLPMWEEATVHTWNCAEQYMMYSKAILFNDTAAAGDIVRAKLPSKQKAFGAQVKNFDEAVWKQEREKIVEHGTWLKFTQQTQEGKRLRARLLETGERELVEASPADRIWGIGFVAQDAEKVTREEWGENLLGKACMRVRERLRREEAEKNEAVAAADVDYNTEAEPPVAA